MLIRGTIALTLAAACAVMVAGPSADTRPVKGVDTIAPAGEDGGIAGGGGNFFSEAFVTGLTRPLQVCAPPGDFDRIFIVEQRSGSTGRIRIFDLNTNTLLGTPFLSISGVSTGDEQGLLGLAFHPDYDTNGYFYVYYTNPTTRIVRYQVSAGDPNLADAGSAMQVMQFSQPQSNHNGGWIGFGPNDGYLYIGSGDGGNFNDQGSGHSAGGNAQDITNNLLGKILRIDVDGDDFPGDPNANYAIPADNPFVGVTGDDEIWSYGLRNPWRCSFDRATGDLYIADVGQNAREEIDFQPASSPGGENYGWRCREGDICSGLSGCDCNDPDLVDPIHTYLNPSVGRSVTGGFVYRGSAIPGLQGTYFFADYISNRIWSLDYDGSNVTNFTERTSQLDPAGGDTITAITSFGEDAAGELYICERGGTVYKIVPGAPTNDECGSATFIAAGPNAISNVNATASGQVESCGPFDADVWYVVIGPCDGTMTLSVCDAAFDSQIAVYAAPCPTGDNSALACNDDSCGTGSEVSLAISAGSLYFIRVGSNGGTGAATLNLECTDITDCTGDFDGSGDVGIGDLLDLLADWGTNGTGADLAEPLDNVDISDLLALLAAWGPCP